MASDVPHLYQRILIQAWHVKKRKFLKKVFIQHFRMNVVTYVNRANYIISVNTIYVNKL